MNEVAVRALSDYVVDVLAAHGVEHVHGYPGASVIPLMGSVHRHPKVEWITYRNEANAALAASASAKLTGRVAVCAATAGPGATNLITGLLDAQVDHAPVLALTGMLDTWRQGRFEFQDLDSARLMAQIVPFSASCAHPQELPSLLAECLGRSSLERCVTHLALPSDIQKTACPSDPLFALGGPQPPRFPSPSSSAYDEAAAALGGSVVIAVGPQARGCGEAIEKLASVLQAPILTAFNSKGIIAEDHPCHVGVLGIFGAPGAEVSSQVLADARVVVSFGLEDLGPFVAAHSGMQARQLVQCEPEAVGLSRRFQRAATLVGPLAQSAAELAARVSPTDGALLAKGARLSAAFFAAHAGRESSAGIHPVRMLEALNRHIPAGAVVALDIGDNAVWAAQFLRLTGRQTVLASQNLGVMGFALPACIAARLASPSGAVVGIAGDGGVQMSIGELAVAVQHKLPFVFVVFRNGVLGRIQAQEQTPFEVEIHSPDFAALARAYGAEGAVVKPGADLDAVLREAFKPREVPFVLDVHLDPTQMAPVAGWKDGFVPLHFS